MTKQLTLDGECAHLHVQINTTYGGWNCGMKFKCIDCNNKTDYPCRNYIDMTPIPC